MFVFSNLATSLDGKIATTSREYFPLGTPEDRREMQRLRKNADVVLFGASTLRTFRRTCKVSGAKTQPANVILSSRLEGISPAWPFFRDRTVRRILFVAASTPERTLRKFEPTCEIIRLRKGSTAQQVLTCLAELGFERVLVEGGGAVMWDFVKEDLIDEYHITHVPRLLGGTEAPTLVDGSGLKPSEVVNLRLKKVRKLGDELYLTYARTGRRGP